jgi:predicted RNA-binding Zn ribbon-like protein
MVKNILIDSILLNGNILCLDFVNTVHDRINESDNDYLSSFTNLLHWAVKAGVVNSKTCNVFMETISKSKSRADISLRETIIVRELLYNIFKTVSKHKKIAETDLHTYNIILSKCLSKLQVSSDKKGYINNWKIRPDELLIIIAPIIYSSYELLLSEKLNRVKECPGCGWLFLDTTKNGKRRWCSMKTCGSNVKALEWYHRQKGK